MRKSKLQRYAEIRSLPNVLELSHYREGDFADVRGKWNSRIFSDSNPITLELACGKGDYTLALARRFPRRNFIGIDIKGDRIWKGAVKACDEGLTNVYFLRVFIDHLRNYFADEEVDSIWITFPDPYSKKERKRLTSPGFLKIYKAILKPGGDVHLKTDDEGLFTYTLETLAQEEAGILEVLRNVHDVGNQEADKADNLPGIKTWYEKQHLNAGRCIKYVRFRFG